MFNPEVIILFNFNLIAQNKRNIMFLVGFFSRNMCLQNYFGCKLTFLFLNKEKGKTIISQTPHAFPNRVSIVSAMNRISNTRLMNRKIKFV